ncbi:hypothetical protein J2I47_01685 [Fibrella sp. HMF5335]|uniref:Uncharacterized protein n=1 Tax=Fibrella rubiginis TaxID=2817060 RepID=A0A939GDI8_9BACT|nr:hypothetical protein [Fibrella rubiginis]MBO0935249.1 hypothetical protein [Fibrella rubiginis]
MENKPDNYDAGIDQNQGVVGTMARNQERSDATDSDDRVSRLDPNVVTGQTAPQPDDENAAEANDDMGERTYMSDEEASEGGVTAQDDTKK